MLRRTPGNYSDRSLASSQTWQKIEPLLPALGITRLARLTDLDRLNIPVWNAVTPNSRSLVISNGKGITDMDAKVSAAMEALERAIAACPNVPIMRRTLSGLRRSGERPLPLDELVAPDQADIGEDELVDWIRASDLFGTSPYYLPYHALCLDRTLVAPRYWQSSDGLASGNTRNEAILHGLLERIERDAYTLWQLSPISRRRAINAASFGDPVIDGMLAGIASAGFALKIFEMTTDTGVPAFTSLLAPAGFRRRRDLTFFDVSMGSGAHPSARRAAIRSITEAAQSRMTFISGARDDIPEDAFSMPCPRDTLACLDLDYCEADPAPEPVLGDVGTLLDGVLDRLRAAGIDVAAAAELSDPSLPVSVVKVIVPQLENPDGHRKRRFGYRALSKVLEVR